MSSTAIRNRLHQIAVDGRVGGADIVDQCHRGDVA